jgi:hypothetical protein
MTSRGANGSENHLSSRVLTRLSLVRGERGKKKFV